MACSDLCTMMAARTVMRGPYLLLRNPDPMVASEKAMKKAEKIHWGSTRSVSFGVRAWK